MMAEKYYRGGEGEGFGGSDGPFRKGVQKWVVVGKLEVGVLANIGNGVYTCSFFAIHYNI